LCIATFAKQHYFSQIEVGELSCRTGCSTRPARDTSGGTWFFFQQFFVQFGIGVIQIQDCAFVSFVSEIYHEFSIFSYQFSVFSYQLSLTGNRFLVVIAGLTRNPFAVRDSVSSTE
jgi:hypothetical protein